MANKKVESERVDVVGTRKPNIFSSDRRIKYGETVDVLVSDAEGLLDSQYVAKPGTKAAERAIAEVTTVHKSQAND